jgi:prepilin-type N-terminal cleavage/methylation domain-containing protein
MRRNRGFTLVELLVVIGIIALLIAMLMPALSRARGAANVVACESNLRQIAMAAMNHAQEHRGFLPFAGVGWTAGNTPAGLGDASEQRYVYYLDTDGKKRAAPIPAALSRYLGSAVRLDSRANLEADCQSGPVRKIFTCPAQEESSQGTMTYDASGTGVGPSIYSSYIFNEYSLGDWSGTGRRKGQLSRIKNQTGNFFLCEGLPRTEFGGVDKLLIISDSAMNVTLWNASVGNAAGTVSVFDYARHRRRMCVVFIDGHAESVPMTQAGLNGVGINVGY